MREQLGVDAGHHPVGASSTDVREGLSPHSYLRQSSGSEIIRDIVRDDDVCDGTLERCFGVGDSAMRCIDSALFGAGREKRSIKRILDLPSGHGRVMRSIRAAFPNAALAPCDLNRSGVDFCAKTFGAVPVYSEIDVDRIRLQGKFDLIWSGSLLTHLSEEHRREFIRLFDSVLDVGGIMMFSTHGRRTEDWMTGGHRNYGLSANQIAELLTSYYQNGFGYVDYSKSNPGYGISICTASFGLTDLLRLTDSDLQLLMYQEHGWDDHQDGVALRKEKVDANGDQEEIPAHLRSLNTPASLRTGRADQLTGSVDDFVSIQD